MVTTLGNVPELERFGVEVVDMSLLLLLWVEDTTDQRTVLRPCHDVQGSSTGTVSIKTKDPNVHPRNLKTWTEFGTVHYTKT